METKHIIAPVLNTLVGDPKKVFEASYAQIHEALRALVKRAIKSGDIRKDLDPIDLLRAIVGVANVSASPDWQQSARQAGRYPDCWCAADKITPRRADGTSTAH